MMYTPIEYMGAGIVMDKDLGLYGSDYVTVKVRIGTSAENADFALIINGISRGEKVTIKCQSTVLSNKWVTLKFPLGSIPLEKLSDVRIKLWAKSNNSRNEQILIDIASVSFHSERNSAPVMIIGIIIGLAVISGITFTMRLIIIRARRRRVR